MRKPHTISIVIPAHNEKDYLGDCLKSCMALKPKSVIEVIVVDNASTDGTAKLARSFPGVTVVHESKKGTNAARECGFRHAKGELIAFLDADTRIPEGWFSAIEREFRKDSELVCLSGPYTFFDLAPWQRRWVDFFWQMFAVPSYSVTGYMVVGGNFVATRKALEAAGGFDTSILFYGDDTNIARRLHEIGTVKYSPKFRVYTSARRLQSQGMFKSGAVYAANYLSEAILHKTAVKESEDVR